MLIQMLLNTMCCTRLLKNVARRHYSCAAFKPSHVFELLKERTLLRVSGNDVTEFLQGLITNDISHLNSEQNSMYTLVLNTKGRVLYDTIIYNNTTENNTFYIDCDVQVAQSLEKHLKLYRVRRKVDITSVEDQYKIYALFNTKNALIIESDDLVAYRVDGSIAPCDKLKETRTHSKLEICGNLQIYDDPRNVYLGNRVIVPENVDAEKEITKFYKLPIATPPLMSYRNFRYYLGVGEGIIDLPPGNCFPLESNCDYLHGVSFHKGCYIGQELTARTHHTGVVRKRLMPLIFTTPLTKLPQEDTILHNETNLGKLRGVEDSAGLGLLRISKALAVGDIKIGNGIAKTLKPKWWPVEMPKERISEKMN